MQLVGVASMASLACAEADGNLHLAWHGSFPRTGDQGLKVG